MAWHAHGRANALIEPRWIDVRDAPMLWATRGAILDGMIEWGVMANEIPWLGMTSRHMDYANWEPRWQDRMQRCIERPWPRVEARSSWMTWPSIVTSQLCRRSLNMHAQMVYVSEQAWIPHKWSLVSEDKSCLRSNEAKKHSKNCESGLIPPLRLVVNMSRSQWRKVEKYDRDIQQPVSECQINSSDPRGTQVRLVDPCVHAQAVYREVLHIQPYLDCKPRSIF